MLEKDDGLKYIDGGYNADEILWSLFHMDLYILCKLIDYMYMQSTLKFILLADNPVDDFYHPTNLGEETGIICLLHTQ